MGMTPDQFYTSFVEGNYWEFEQEPDNVRRAFNAAVAASHMADHYYEYCRRHDRVRVTQFPKLKDYIAYVCQKTDGCFRDVRSIANAYKHLYTRQEACIESTGAIAAVTRLTTGIAEVEYGHEEGTNRLTVVFRRRTGEQLELLPVLKRVVDFWLEETHS